jgi:hypothetical protein
VKIAQRVGVATRPRSDANRCRLNTSKGTWGRLATETVRRPVRGSGRKEARSLAWMPKPSKIMNARYWSPGLGSPM